MEADVEGNAVEDEDKGRGWNDVSSSHKDCQQPLEATKRQGRTLP